MIFLPLLRLGFCLDGWSNSSLWLYPLFLSASWNGGAAESNVFLSEEMSLSLLFIASGMLRKIDGGWLLHMCTY